VSNVLEIKEMSSFLQLVTSSSYCFPKSPSNVIQPLLGVVFVSLWNRIWGEIKRHKNPNASSILLYNFSFSTMEFGSSFVPIVIMHKPFLCMRMTICDFHSKWLNRVRFFYQGWSIIVVLSDLDVSSSCKKVC